VHAVTRTTHHTYACPKNAPHDDLSIHQSEEPRAAMDTPHLPTMPETWSAMRVAYAALPAATIAAIVPQRDPETAARVPAIITEFDEREAPRNAEIAQQEAASTAAVLATGATEYILAPGAAKCPCMVETAINSDVEGYFTAKVSTNVYDTVTGRHLLVPQGSMILGHDQSSVLLYGNERLPTISLTLALPDGRSVDLGQAPVTDQQGVAGLTGRVNNHYWRLFGAVFIGGALRGGMQALQIGLAQAGGAGQVAAGISSVGNQAVTQRLGRALDTRPTIEVDAGQLCNVLLTKPLHLPALWQ
jgi:type IV secretory pathway VirB10-like protein